MMIKLTIISIIIHRIGHGESNFSEKKTGETSH